MTPHDKLVLTMTSVNIALSIINFYILVGNVLFIRFSQKTFAVLEEHYKKAMQVRA